MRYVNGVRHVKYLLWVALALVAAGVFVVYCGRGAGGQADLAVADSLIECGAYDEALAVLDSVDASPRYVDESVRARSTVLRIKALNKSDAPLPPDSIIRSVVRFYETTRGESRSHLADAYYYAGRTFREEGNAHVALDYFLKAVDSYGDSRMELHHKATAYSQIANVYVYQRMNDFAVDAFRRAASLNEMLADSSMLIANYQMLAASFLGLDDDSAFVYLEKAETLAFKFPDSEWTALVINLKSHLLVDAGQYDEAEKTLRPLLATAGRMGTSVNSIAARLFHDSGRYDSAALYFDKMISYGNIYARQEGCYGLAEIAMSEGSAERAMAYLERYCALTDSIANLTEAERVRQVQMAYNADRQMRREQLLDRAKQRAQATAVVIGSLSFVVIVLLAGIVSRLRMKRREVSLRHARVEKELADYRAMTEENIGRLQDKLNARQTLLQHATERLRDYRTRIAEMRTRQADYASVANNAKRLEAEVDALRQQSAVLQAEIDKQRAESTIRFNSMQMERAAFARHPLCDDLHKAHGMTHALDTKIEDFFRQNNPDFLSRFENLAPKSVEERRVSMLLRLGSQQKHIAILMAGTSTQNIHYHRCKLAQRFISPDAKAEDWNKFVESM